MKIAMVQPNGGTTYEQFEGFMDGLFKRKPQRMPLAQPKPATVPPQRLAQPQKPVAPPVAPVSATARFEALVSRIVAAEGLDYAEAALEASRRDRELYFAHCEQVRGI